LLFEEADLGSCRFIWWPISKPPSLGPAPPRLNQANLVGRQASGCRICVARGFAGAKLGGCRLDAPPALHAQEPCASLDLPRRSTLP